MHLNRQRTQAPSSGAADDATGSRSLRESRPLAPRTFTLEIVRAAELRRAQLTAAESAAFETARRTFERWCARSSRSPAGFRDLVYLSTGGPAGRGALEAFCQARRLVCVARLRRDLTRIEPAWRVLCDVGAACAHRIGAVELTLVHPQRRLRVPFELVGFWTPAYLRARIAATRHRRAPPPPLLGIDESLGVWPLAEGSTEPRLLVYRRHVDVEALLQLIDRLLSGDRDPAETRCTASPSGRRAALATTRTLDPHDAHRYR